MGGSPTHREAMQAFFAAKGIATRTQARKLYVVRRKGWNGCVAYVEFESPDATVWDELLARCRLRVIPLAGRHNWEYCAQVESELLAILDDRGPAP